ncbi:hypothetical protein F5Y05DRAFT_423688 [Hypoxylon sp. FL0543]|nr:hypothetical protein F5Y05DRAFT_423688 [Hypoxylon sp. FL0543]
MASPTESPVADNDSVSDNHESFADDSVEQAYKRKNTDEVDGDYVPNDVSSKRQKAESARSVQGQAQLPASSNTHPVASHAVGGPGSDALASAIATFHKDKPDPSAEPPAWAEKRAAINDALPYFKSHNGSLHTINKVPQGMLIDAEVGPTDYFGSQVIITTLGGGRVAEEGTGKMVRTADQSEDCKSFVALDHARREKTPVAIVAGAKNSLFPSKPPHYYSVLDNFHVTDLWNEAVPGLNGQILSQFMVRFEKIDLAARSWWTPKDSVGHEAGEFRVGEYHCPSRSCTSCKEQSKEIYKQGWTCLNRLCEKFFQSSTGMKIQTPEYSEAFLRERTAYTSSRPQHTLIPALPVLKGNNSGSEKEFKLGIVCPRCHCCSRRILWHHWYCENPKCDFTYKIPIRTVSIREVIKQNLKIMRRQNTYKKHNKLFVTSFDNRVGEYLVTTFFLRAHENGPYFGSVTRLRPSRKARRRFGGIDDIFIEKDSIGVPYKYGVVVDDTIPWLLAERIILEILKRLTWAGKAAVEFTIQCIEELGLVIVDGAIPAEFEPYNEQLVLGYFEKSKISPHDDGEKELGPNVATLSLGSPSVMKFIPKKGSGIGDEKSTILSFILKHGDMMVMHGAQIQRLTNHAVDAHGTLRYAMTCRHIRPELIPDEEQRKLAVENARLPAEWNDIQYNGELDQLESITTGEEVSRPVSN